MDSGIDIRHVSFIYPGGTKALSNISLVIHKGEFTAFLGSNGSGKSTLSLLLNGLIPHLVNGIFSGSVIIDGVATKEKSVAKFSQKIGMVFQNPDFSLFNLTVYEEIAFGLNNLHLPNTKKQADDVLSLVGLPGYGERDPQTLSTGEKQKIAIACALATEPDYLVLDEPVAQLDYKSSLDIYTLLQKLHNQGKTILVVEHDTDYVRRFSTRVVVLDKGKIVADGPTEKVLSDTTLFESLGLKIAAILP